MPRKIKLTEGVAGSFIKTDKFKSLIISVSFYSPLKEELAAESAMLPYLLTGGSPSYPDFSSLNRRLDMLFGAGLSVSVEKLGDMLETNIRINALCDRFSGEEGTAAEAAALLCDLIFERYRKNYGFREDEIRRERRLLREAIEGEINDKRRYARARCEAITGEGEPFGFSRLGTVEQAEAVTAGSLQRAYLDLLKKCAVDIRVIGDEMPKGVFERFTDEFSAVGREYSPLPESVARAASPCRRVTEKMDIKQGKLVLALRTENGGGDDKTIPLYVMADLFGGGAYSRLFNNVREKLSLCYYCSARAVRKKGIIFVESGVAAENGARAEQAILHELDEIAAGRFSDGEMKNTIRSLTDSINSFDDDPILIDCWYAARFADERPLSPDEFCARVKEVTAEEVARAAAELRLDTVYLLTGEEEKTE